MHICCEMWLVPLCSRLTHKPRTLTRARRLVANHASALVTFVTAIWLVLVNSPRRARIYQPFHLTIVFDQGSVGRTFYAKVTRIPLDCIQVRFGCHVGRRATRLFMSFHVPIACKAHKDVALWALPGLTLLIEALGRDPDAANL